MTRAALYVDGVRCAVGSLRLSIVRVGRRRVIPPLPDIVMRARVFPPSTFDWTSIKHRPVSLRWRGVSGRWWMEPTIQSYRSGLVALKFTAVPAGPITLIGRAALKGLR